MIIYNYLGSQIPLSRFGLLILRRSAVDLSTMPWFSDFLDDVFDGITEDLVDDILGGVKDVINDARTIEQGIAEIAKDPEFRAEVSRDVDKFLFPTDTTDHYKLTPEQASTPCTDYTPKKLLDTLNLYTGKSHAIRSHERLEETLTTACDGLKPCDFGTIYSWYRLGAAGEIWGTDLWRSLWEPRYRADAAILTTDKDDGQQYIPNPPEADPLRLWDLYSHRVITYRWFKNSDWSVSNWVRYTEYADYWAISHSWVSAHDRVNLTTPVNQEQYPVPIPEGVTLEAVRDELLGMGAQFCWLDILCLRQRYISISGDPLPGWGKKIVYGRSWPELEELRKEEWKTDIPMIGQIYEKSKQTIRWYNGLGRPFTETGWGDNRHWCNRVWTLQENSGWEDSMLTGGYPGGKLDLSTLCQVIQAPHLSSIACLYIDTFANYILCG